MGCRKAKKIKGITIYIFAWGIVFLSFYMREKDYTELIYCKNVGCKIEEQNLQYFIKNVILCLTLFN